jgi:predicted phosphohydrolase
MEKSADELREQFGHWEGHPVHPVSEWRQEVQAEDTRLGYWEWVATLLEAEAESETISAIEDAARTA